MRITYRDPLSRNRTQEGSQFTLTAKFWDNGGEPWIASTPTTIKWRVDCLTTGVVMLDWTTVSAASSVSLSCTAAINAINDQLQDREKRQVTVKTNDGLSTQYQDTWTYFVENNTAV